MNTEYKIAIFFDGTCKTVDYPENFSNVKKLKDRVVGRYTYDDITTITKTFYMEGPGTLPQSNTLDSAFAFHLSDIILDAYKWLSQTYSDFLKRAQAPEIYLFGFSRGGYIAHIFSWILNDIGVTSKYSYIPKLIESYMNKKTKKLEQLKKRISPDEFFTPCIRMLGLWDMVLAPLDFYSKFHDGERAPIVQHIYHAMSLDEKRFLFPLLKYKEEDARTEQRWFSGVHSDIGGGYEDTVLSDITLDWMIDNAAGEDLIIKELNSPEEDLQGAVDFLQMQIHDESGYQNSPRLFEGENIDESVYRRMAQDHSYHPFAKNFPDERQVYDQA